jgi:peptide/nickel transport system substrate-binding protein
MKKNTLISLLLVLLLLVLAACSSGTDTGTSGEEQEVQATEAPAEEEEMAEEEAPAEETEAEAGGGIVAEESSSEDTTVTEASEFNQAPMLDDMDLPPVDERLPIKEDIAVVTPVDGVGQYGGTWHNVSWAQDIPNIKMVLYDGPVRWKADYTGYEPGLAKSFEYSDDGTQLTWHFREGVKWSDGEPFTMSDMQFWWEDLATNDDYKVITIPWWGFNSDGSPMTVEFPDDYTMVMTWDTPRWVTTYIVAQGFWEWEPMMKPRHYLEQFHPDYSDSGTYEDLEQASKWYENPDHPVLFAWTVESSTPGERTVLVRNPYYWKVDTEGNQLPYIDRLDIAIIPDAEVRTLEASQGKYEASFRATDSPNDIPFLAEQAEANGYSLHPGAVNGAGGWPCWLINQNFADESVDNWEEVGDVLRDVNFRKGISHAMDRERLIDVAWDGIGYPTQSTISPQAWHFASAEGQAVYEEWRDADVEYDVDLANELLDAAGVVDADGDGFRDLPSGAPFTLVFDLNGWGTPRVVVPATESFSSDLADVGINTLINNVTDTPEDNLRQIEGFFMLRNCHASELDIWTFPDWIFPLRDNRAWPLEGKYRQTGGEEGWEPTGAALALQEIYDQGLATETVEERHQLVYDAIRIHIEEGPFVLGSSGDQPVPVIVGNNFHGIPDTVILGPWAPGSPGNLHPEQFWMDQ